jgi:hypothetical protein
VGDDRVEEDEVEKKDDEMIMMLKMTVMLGMIMFRRMMKRMIMWMLRDEVEVDDAESDEVKGAQDCKMMMFKMMILRRGKRKIMMLRTMMLRRRTDPKTGSHTLCEPAQSKYRWTCHKSQKQFYAELYKHKA